MQWTSLPGLACKLLLGCADVLATKLSACQKLISNARGKGCTEPEMSQRMHSLIKEFMTVRAQSAMLEDTDTNGSLTRMLAMSQLKFGSVADLPFFFWQVNSPSNEIACLKKFGTAETPHHRVLVCASANS